MKHREMGKLVGVGVGPGEPDLMTLKAVRAIEECHVILLPDGGKGVPVAYEIAKGAVDTIDTKEIVKLNMPMTRDHEELRTSHREAADRVIELIKLGKKAVFLTLGDPSVYSTYIYVHDIVVSEGYRAEMIPGIPSFCAVAARLNIGLTEAGKPLHIIPASYDCINDGLAMTGTKVLMKSGKSIGKVKDILMKMEGIEVHMVENCGMKDEKIYDNVEKIDGGAGYFSTLIVRDKK